MPFSFHNQDLSPHDQLTFWCLRQDNGQEWGQVPQWGQNRGQRQQELWVTPPQLSLLSSDHGLESDRSTVSTSSSVSSMSERSGGSRHPHHGRHPHKEPGGHVKINLPVFKEEDTKDAITYQSWCWDLIVYCHAGCWDHTLLPYTICSLQGYTGGASEKFGYGHYPGWHVLTILDKHYNNIKALDALHQELFLTMYGWKGDSIWLGSAFIKTPAYSHSILPRMLSLQTA